MYSDVAARAVQRDRSDFFLVGGRLMATRLRRRSPASLRPLVSIDPRMHADFSRSHSLVSSLTFTMQYVTLV